jgi:hypothetical protein
MSRRTLSSLLLLASLAAAQPPAEEGSDLVLVVDVTSSMRKNDALPRMRKLVYGILEETVRPGSQVAIVPFGEGVHEIQRFDAGSDEGGAAEVKSRVNSALEGLKARDSYSYLGAAIDAGIETLRQFKERSPGHTRHLIVVTDGPQFVARGDPAPELSAILDGWREKGMKAPDDWFLWYCYFGEPDAAFLATLDRSDAGRAVALDQLEDLAWTFTHVEMKKTDLGAKGGPSWTARVPFAAKSSGSAVGRRLRLSVGGTLPPGMEVTVSPREMVLVGRSTEIEIQLICTGAQPGAYDGLVLLVEGLGALHWAEPGRIPLRFRVGEPRLTVKQTKVDLGRVAPGATVKGQVVLAPNADAAAAPPTVGFTVVRAPAGVKIEPVPAPAAEGEMALGFAVTVPGDAKEGTGECRLKLDAGDTALSAPEVRVTYVVASPRVVVAGTLKIEAAAGEDVTGELTLTPDAAAAALAAPVRAVVRDGLPKGVTVETPTVLTKGQATFAVHVRVAGDVKEGSYRTSVALSAPGVRVDPPEVSLDVSIIRPPEPPVLKLPSSLDLGDVPRDYAKELTGRFTVDLPPGYEGTDLVLEGGGSSKVLSDPVPLATGSNEVTFRLKPASLETGEQVEFVRVLARRARHAREAGMIALRWAITNGQLAVKEVRNPAALPFRGGTAKATLALESSEDLKGKVVTMTASFEGLPEGMSASLATDKVELTGGAQEVPVELNVAEAPTGSYRGKIDLALQSGLVLASAQVPFVVRPLSVSVRLEGSLEGLSTENDRSVTLIVTTDEALVNGVDLAVQVDRAGLPEDVSIQTLETASLRRAGDVRVPVKFRVAPGTKAGTWEPRVTLSAPDEGVVIEPKSFDLTVVVPEPVVATAAMTAPVDAHRSFWGLLSIVAVVLTALTARYVGRSKDDLLLQVNS